MVPLTPDRSDYAEAVRLLHSRSPLADHLGIIFDRIEQGFVTGYLPYRPEQPQQDFNRIFGPAVEYFRRAV